MIASLKKQRSAALRPSRNVSSRRLLVESLEERRVLDSEGLLVTGGTMIAPSSTALSLNDSLTVDVSYMAIDAEPGMTATWSLYWDNGEDNIFGVMPGNGQLDIIPDLMNPTEMVIVDQFVVAYAAVDAAAPQAEVWYSLAPFAKTASEMYAALPVEAQTEDVRLLAVVTFSDGTQSEMYAIAFQINAGMTSSAQSPVVGDIAGPGNAVVGQTATFDVTVSDADSLATDLEHLWTVHDINTGAVVAGGVIVTSAAQTPTLDFTPTYNGSFSVSYSVMDELGQQGSATSVLLVVGNRSLVGNDLFVSAKTTGSNVSITSTSGGTAVSIDGQSITYSGLESIVVYGQAGNDIVIVGTNVTTPVTMFGGAGKDILRGGAGADILVGGEGVDIIIGGGGRDLIVGGIGSDILIGDSGDDILIAGYTIYDQDAAALASIRAIWNGSNAVLTRIAQLETSWLNSSTVFDDDATDLLTGNAGFDWFFANLALDGQNDRRDLILDRTAAEFQEYVELINEE